MKRLTLPAIPAIVSLHLILALAIESRVAAQSSATSKSVGSDAVTSSTVTPSQPTPSQPTPSQPTPSQVDATRTALEQWVAMRRLISIERKDWELGRELLNDRIALVEREIESLRSRITDAEASIQDANTKQAKLVAESQHLGEAAAALSQTVTTFEHRTRSLLQRLPEPIREHVDLLAQRLPEDPAITKLSLGARFQNVVGILNEIDKFNSDITVKREVRVLGDGRSTEVTTFYVGIGQGYYVTDRGDAAGVGTASDTGWIWLPAHDSAEPIAKAIAILRNEQPAAFVPLPVRVQ